MKDKSFVQFSCCRKAAFVAVFLAFFSGCTSPFIVQNGFGGIGSLRLSGVVAGETGAQTVFPDASLVAIESYTITLGESEDGRPDGAGFHEQTIESGEFDDVEFTDLVPGEWTIEVAGYDSPDGDEDNGAMLVTGTVEDVTIERGEVEEITVPVSPTGEGEGSFELTLDWENAFDEVDTPDTDVVTDYKYTLTDLEDEGIEVSGDSDEDGWDDTDATSVTLRSEDVPAGQYLLGVELINEDSADETYEVVSTYYEVWYIFGGAETEAEKRLSEAHFSFGGGATINIELETPDDLEGFFEATTESTVAAGEIATLRLGDVSEEIDTENGDNVIWRIDGDKASSVDEADETRDDITIDQADEEKLKFKPEAEFPPGVTLNITLQIEKDGDFYSGSHAMTVGQPE